MKILNKVTAVLLAVILSVYVIIAPVKAKAFILELTAAETALVLLIGGILVTAGYMTIDELSEMSPGDLNNYIAGNAFDFSGLDSQTKGSLTQDMHDYIHSPEGAKVLVDIIGGAVSLPSDAAGFFNDWFYESSQDIPAVPTAGGFDTLGYGAIMDIIYINIYTGKTYQHLIQYSDYGTVYIGDNGLMAFYSHSVNNPIRCYCDFHTTWSENNNTWVSRRGGILTKPGVYDSYVRVYGDWRVEGTLEPYTGTEDFTYTYPIVGTVDIGGTQITITSDGTAADEQGNIYPFEDGAVIAGGVPYFPEFNFSAYGLDSLFNLIASLFNAVEEAVEEIAGEEEEEIQTNGNSLTGPPDATLPRTNNNGEVIGDRTYDSDGKAFEDTDYTDHGNPAQHPKVPHKHSWDWSNPDNPSRSTWY